MVAKLSSVRVMSAAPLATSVPVMPMAQPMSAAFRAGASFTPSPVMADYLPFALPGLHDPNFVFRGDAGAYGDASPPASSSSLIRYGVQLRAGDGPVPRSKNPQILGDGRGRGHMVPGNHYRADPRPTAGGNRLPALPGGAGRSCPQGRSRSDRFPALRAGDVRESCGFPGRLLASTRRARPLISSQIRRAAVQIAGHTAIGKHVECSLYDHYLLFSHLVQGGHPLSV